MEKISLVPKGTQYRVSTPNLESVEKFPYTFKWVKLPGKTVVISRVLVTVINPIEGGKTEVVFSVSTARESFSRMFRSGSDLVRSCDKVDTQSIVKESISKFYFDIQPPIILENKNDSIALILREKPNLADQGYVLCEGWMYDSDEVKAKDIMRPAIYVNEGSFVSEAVKLMAENKISALLISKYEDVMLGNTVRIITEQDIVQNVLSEGLSPEATPVERIMSTPLITISSEDSLDEIIEIMVKKNIHTIPVEEKGKIVGIITDQDVVRAIPVYFRGASKKRIFMNF